MIPAWALAMMEADGDFSPLALGSKLKAWWAPPGGANTTLNGSGIAGWTDEVGGYVLGQATAASQPTYDATSFNGAACAEFDAIDDYLLLEPVPAGIPQGANPSEVWVALRQDAGAADTEVRLAYSQGGATGGSRRDLRRLVSGGANRAAAFASGTTAANASVDFSGYHAVRTRLGASSIQADVDGVAGSSAAASLNTDGTRLVVGALSNLTTNNAWNGAIRQVVVTEPLSADEAAAMYAFLNQDL